MPTCCQIAPGYFPSELTAAYIDSEAFIQLHKDRCPKERHGVTGEMDGLCIYFASPCCSYTTGQTVCVDGGWTCKLTCYVFRQEDETWAMKRL